MNGSHVLVDKIYDAFDSKFDRENLDIVICPPDVWLQAFCWGTFILCFECLHIFICLGQLYGNELRFSYASQLAEKHNLTTKNSSNIL